MADVISGQLQSGYILVVMPCGPIIKYQCFREIYHLHLQGYVSLKSLYLPIRPHSITIHKNDTDIFIATGTCNITQGTGFFFVSILKFYLPQGHFKVWHILLLLNTQSSCMIYVLSSSSLPCPFTVLLHNLFLLQSCNEFGSSILYR